jgi:hypothetical protein
MRSCNSVSDMAWRCACWAGSARSVQLLLVAWQIFVPFSAISAPNVDLTPDSSSTRRDTQANRVKTRSVGSSTARVG